MSKRSKLLLTAQFIIALCSALSLLFAPWWGGLSVLALDVTLTPDTKLEED